MRCGSGALILFQVGQILRAQRFFWRLADMLIGLLWRLALLDQTIRRNYLMEPERGITFIDGIENTNPPNANESPKTNRGAA